MPAPQNAEHSIRPFSELAKCLCIISAVFLLLFAGIYGSGLSWKNNYWRDYSNRVLGVDFVNGWLMGKAALTQEHPEKNYDIPTYMQYLREVVKDPEYVINQWSYPPSYMLIMTPFALLPYLAAWAVFMSMSLALLAWALRQYHTGHVRALFLTILGMPAGLLAIMSGQITVMATAIQLLVFQWLDKRPLLAGVLLGALSLKPQIGIVFPLFLIATKRWKTFVAAAATTITILLLTTIIWGSDVWLAYWQQGIPMQTEYVLYHTPRAVEIMMPTFFMDIKMMGVDYPTALTLQAMLACAAVTVFFTRSFRQMHGQEQMVIVAAAGILATPYLMAYDTLFFASALLVYLYQQYAGGKRDAFLIAAACFFPLIHLLAALAKIPGSSLIPCLIIWWLWNKNSHANRVLEAV